MRLLIALLLILAACRPAAPDVTPAPPTVALTGSVVIVEPLNGSSIFSEVMRLRGTASSLPEDRFVLVLSGIDQGEMLRIQVPVTNGAWTLDLLHGYADVPTEVSIEARPLDPNLVEAYDRVSAVLGGLEYRPEGVFTSIQTAQVEGDILRVVGSSSGSEAAEIMVRLRSPADVILSESSVTIRNPYVVNIVPWRLDLPRQGYTGAATLEIRDSDGQILDSLPVEIDDAAG